MGREPLGLLDPSRLHTGLPWPAQRTPRPGTLARFSNKKFKWACSARGTWEAVAGDEEIFWKLFGQLLDWAIQPMP
eukprot:1138119-Pelagomonas_calceolata.AAC.1